MKHRNNPLSSKNFRKKISLSLINKDIDEKYLVKSHSVSIYEHINSILYKRTLKIIFKNIKQFQVRAYWNMLVRTPHPVISNTGWNIYYTMDQKSIGETSVITLRLENMINVCSAKQLTRSVCFNHWSIKKWT